MKLPLFWSLLLAAPLSAQVQVESLPEAGMQPHAAADGHGSLGL